MKPAMNRILFVVQLPPPVHGASMMNEYLVNSKTVHDNFEISVVDVATAHQIDSIGKFSVKKVFSSIAIFFRIFFRLVKFKPGLVYFTLSPSGLAFYRDAFFIFLIRLFKPKIVYHLHGKGIQAESRRSRFYRLVSRKVFKGSYVIHLSPTLAKDTAGLDIKKSFVVANGIPVIDTVQKTNNERPQLLFLSNYVRTKGVVDVIDAVEIVARENSNFHLCLAGKPFDVSIGELKERINRKGLDELVSVCGPVYGKDKYEMLASSDVFIFPTYYPNEAFPLALLEAMQFGLVCISTRVGGIPDMILDGETGFLVEERNITDLAGKIRQVLNQPGAISSMGEKAKEEFVSKYTVSIFERNMVSTFNDILNRAQ
jgi:glycosyltransferase involved in cell wall biosynthesis